MPGWGAFPWGGSPFGGSSLGYWTIPGKSWKQQLLEFAQEALPKYWSKAPRKQEDLNAIAEIMAIALGVAMDRIRQTYILDAEGPWLRQHARDRGISLQEGESEASLRQRIRTVADAVTRPALLAGVQAILATAGVGGQAAAVDLRRDRAFYGVSEERVTTGATFGASNDGLLTILPDAPFELPIEVGFARSGRQANPRVYIVDWPAAPALEEVPLEVVALSGNALVVDVAAQAPGHEANATIHLWKYDTEATDVQRDEDPPRARAFRGRGYRRNGSRSGFAFILPYGTPDGAVNSVRDYLRIWKAFGVRSAVEVRENP